MADIFSTSTETILTLGKITLGLQAIGVVTLLIIILQILGFYINWKRMNTLKKFETKIEKIEKNIERMLSKKKSK